MEIDVKQATEILTDPKNPYYEASKQPGEVRDAIFRAYERAHPCDFNLNECLPAHLNDEAILGPGQHQTEEVQPKATTTTNPETQPPEQTGLSVEAAQAIDQAVAQLQEKYGDEAPGVVARAQNVSAYLEHDNPMWPRMVEVALQKGITQTVMVEILNEVGELFGFENKR